MLAAVVVRETGFALARPLVLGVSQGRHRSPSPARLLVPPLPRFMVDLGGIGPPPVWFCGPLATSSRPTTEQEHGELNARRQRRAHRALAFVSYVPPPITIPKRCLVIQDASNTSNGDARSCNYLISTARATFSEISFDLLFACHSSVSTRLGRRARNTVNENFTSELYTLRCRSSGVGTLCIGPHNPLTHRILGCEKLNDLVAGSR